MRPGFASLAIALALAPALAAPGASAGHSPPAMTQPYTGQPVGGGCTEIAGHACPQVPDSGVQFGPFTDPPRAVDIRIDDALGARIGAVYTFYDANGVATRSGGMCGEATRLHAPAGTYFVTVSLDSPANLGHHCGAPRYGTAGNVLLRLRGTASAQVDDVA